jgi:hypothetical protein
LTTTTPGVPSRSEQQRAEDAQRDREREHAQVQRGRDAQRPAAQQQRPGERPGPAPGENDPQGAAERRKQQALGEELSNQPAPARPQGQARGDLAPARRRTYEQQAADVRARHEQDRADGPREQHQRGLQLVAQVLEALAAGEQRDPGQLVLAPGLRIQDRVNRSPGLQPPWRRLTVGRTPTERGIVLLSDDKAERFDRRARRG